MLVLLSYILVSLSLTHFLVVRFNTSELEDLSGCKTDFHFLLRLSEWTFMLPPVCLLCADIYRLFLNFTYCLCMCLVSSTLSLTPVSSCGAATMKIRSTVGPRKVHRWTGPSVDQERWGHSGTWGVNELDATASSEILVVVQYHTLMMKISTFVTSETRLCFRRWLRWFVC